MATPLLGLVKRRIDFCLFEPSVPDVPAEPIEMSRRLSSPAVRRLLYAHCFLPLVLVLVLAILVAARRIFGSSNSASADTRFCQLFPFSCFAPTDNRIPFPAGSTIRHGSCVLGPGVLVRLGPGVAAVSAHFSSASDINEKPFRLSRDPFFSFTVCGVGFSISLERRL